LVLIKVATVVALASATILDFEDVPAGTTVTTQYGDRGVVFPNAAYVDTDPAAHSGTQVLRSDCPCNEFNTAPLVIEFTSGQARVSMFAGASSEAPVDGTLSAFDADGVMIAQDGPKPVAINAFTTIFEVSVAEAVITRVELKMGTTHFEAIDDLEFEGLTAPPVPTTPPTVDISSPADGELLDVSSLLIEGTVTGVSLFPTAKIIVKFGLPPDSTAGPLTISVPLAGTGTTRTFSQLISAIPGPYTVTVEADNTANLTGSDTVSFTNLPAAIHARFVADGGTATFGGLIYGAGAEGCLIGVYDKGAISLLGGVTHTILGNIFDKWFSLRELAAPLPELGCPNAEQGGAPGGGSARAQDFQHGRIVSVPAIGTHFIPEVFVDAIDKLGGQEATGAPLSDPTSSSGVSQTWLFQRFQQFHGGLPRLTSTLEIRGNPPTLWVERQGSDVLPVFDDDTFAGAPDLATIWNRFPCSDLNGPCTVTPPGSGPGLDLPTAQSFCADSSGDVGKFPFSSGVPEWPAVVGDYVSTSVLGVVEKSEMAGRDWPLTHEYHAGPLSFRSDWNVKLRPLHPFRNLLAINKTLEIEFENAYYNHFGVGWDWPKIGDLLFVSGRWIIDCGHDADDSTSVLEFNSEIHPPAVIAIMRTVEHEGHQATRADIFVTGWYAGDPVEFDIFPPPRPSPDAFLTVVKPVDSEATRNVSIDWTFPSFMGAHVRFTAPLRENEVTGDGWLKWGTGRGYEGRWFVYWSE